MADSGLKPPPAFDSHGRDGDMGDIAQRWDRWVEHYSFYMKATEKDKKSKAIQTAILLTLLGENGMDIYRTFEWEDPAHKDDVVKVIEKFTDYFTPRQNVIFERYKFLKRKQESAEQFDTFFTALVNLSKTCKYDGAEKNNIIRDQIVIGLQSDSLRRDLLYEKDLTLDQAVSICRNKEATKQFAEKMGSRESKECQDGGEVSAVQMQSDRGGGATGGATATGGMQQRFGDHSGGPSKNYVRLCRNCDRSHPPRSCPAYGKRCLRCQNFNHFARCCRSMANPTQKKNVHTVTDVASGEVHGCSETDPRNLFAFSVKRVHTVGARHEEDEWYEKVQINSNHLYIKVDTGATCNVMPKVLYEKHCKNDQLYKCRDKLQAYGGYLLTVVGKCTLNVEHRNKYYVQEFIVVDEDVKMLLGLSGCRNLGLVDQKVHNVNDCNYSSDNIDVHEYSDVFEGIGLIPGEHHISLREDAVPVIYAARRVPFRLRDKFKAQLDEMEQRGIVIKVTEPTEWVNPLVVVLKKDNTLRICLDPGPLNKAVRREHYTLPTAEDIFSRLHGSQYFTTLDARSGFLQMGLDLPSSYLTTFATPFGRYRYSRLPYGLSSAPEVYHRAMVEHFSDIEGVEIFVDDILVHAPTEALHDSILKRVLDRCRQINLTLNRDKCRFKRQEVTYLGHLISTQGLQADPRKVEAIVKMPVPKNKEDVRRFLGMVTYLSKFCPGLSELTLPLRTLIRHDVAWQWDAQHDACVKAVKETVQKQPVLRHFDQSEEVTLSVDSSQEGLGAVILQNGQPVEYASCTLTQTQQRYAQIEKEMLAIQYGLSRFHQYVYGKRVTVETDHKPLLSIIQQPIAGLSPRLQRMRMRCQPYDVNLVYKPGKSLILADFLSRAQVADTYEGTDHLDDEAIQAVCSLVLQNEVSKQRIKESTESDVVLQMLKDTICQGWPTMKKKCPNALKPYWIHRHEIAECDGLLFKAQQVIIPTVLRREVIRNIHQGHLGIVKCLERAKSSAYWPGYLQQLKDTVESCSTCQEHRDANPPAFLQQYEVPEYPYQVLGSDLFELDGVSYLLTIDYFSKWPCVEKLVDTKSSTIIGHLEKQFCNFGVPEKFISDNGAQYTSSEFQDFMKKLHIDHVTSSPYYASSNGMAERTVKTIKTSLKKMLADGKSLLQVLSSIRSTPLGQGLPSPAVLLQSRNLRCDLHQVPAALKPQNVDFESVRKVLLGRQAKNSYYDSGKHRTLHTYRPGDVVRTRQGSRWLPAKIVRHAKEPNSYWLRRENGSVVRRNQQDINPCKEHSQWPSSDSPTTTRSGRISQKPARFGN